MASGAPTLLNKANNVANTVILLGADAAAIFGLFPKPVWGIYKGGKAIIKADSVVSVEFKRDWRLADYPQEQGAFQSYNKVTTPFDARVRLTKGGSDSVLSAFLDDVDAAAKSLDLFDVVTSSKTYNSANIHHYDYKRSANSGSGLLTVDVWLTEVRVTVTDKFSTTAAPSGADPKAVGTVQAQAPTGTQAAATKAVK